METRDDQLDHEIDEAEAEVEGETKEEKFRRLANHRLITACKRIRMFIPLANANNYDFDEDQAQFIITALRLEVDKVEEAFSRYDPEESFPQL